MTDFLTAAEASKLAENALSIMGEFAKQETINVLSQIKEVASKGEKSFSLPSQYRGQVKLALLKRLRELGYKIREDHDPRDCASWTTISW